MPIIPGKISETEPKKLKDETPDKVPDNAPGADPEQVSEIVSDGSASAFEGTEFRDQDDRDQELSKRIQNQADPSGRSDY